MQIIIRIIRIRILNEKYNIKTGYIHSKSIEIFRNFNFRILKIKF